uniref:Uncharacterized protein n=1 Tax=Rhizophora mucronata TaxID=61149 RepID=A0A2P2LQ60_RHIMU
MNICCMGKSTRHTIGLNILFLSHHVLKLVLGCLDVAPLDVIV